jgi:hypothetical protein
MNKIAGTDFVQWWMKEIDPKWMDFKENFGTNFADNWEETCNTAIRMLEDPTYWTEIGESFGEVFGWLGDEIGAKVSDFWEGVQDWWSKITGQKRAKGNRDSRAKSGSIETNSGYERSLGQKVWDVMTWTPFANGGFVKANNPIPAIIGDNKSQNEWVFPEDKLKALLIEASSMGGNNGNTELLNQILQAILSLNLTANVDATALARVVIKLINQESRATGRSLV